MDQFELPLEEDPEDEEEYIQVEVIRDPELEEFEGGYIVPDSVLRGAMGRLREVIVIGKEPDGEYYYAASNADGRWAIFHAERFKEFIMRQIY